MSPSDTSPPSNRHLNEDQCIKGRGPEDVLISKKLDFVRAPPTHRFPSWPVYLNKECSVRLYHQLSHRHAGPSLGWQSDTDNFASLARLHRSPAQYFRKRDRHRFHDTFIDVNQHASCSSKIKSSSVDNTQRHPEGLYDATGICEKHKSEVIVPFLSNDCEGGTRSVDHCVPEKQDDVIKDRSTFQLLTRRSVPSFDTSTLTDKTRHRLEKIWSRTAGSEASCMNVNEGSENQLSWQSIADPPLERLSDLIPPTANVKAVGALRRTSTRLQQKAQILFQDTLALSSEQGHGRKYGKSASSLKTVRDHQDFVDGCACRASSSKTPLVCTNPAANGNDSLSCSEIAISKRNQMCIDDDLAASLDEVMRITADALELDDISLVAVKLENDHREVSSGQSQRSRHHESSLKTTTFSGKLAKREDEKLACLVLASFPSGKQGELLTIDEENIVCLHDLDMHHTARVADSMQRVSAEMSSSTQSRRLMSMSQKQSESGRINESDDASVKSLRPERSGSPVWYKHNKFERDHLTFVDSPKRLIISFACVEGIPLDFNSANGGDTFCTPHIRRAIKSNTGSRATKKRRKGDEKYALAFAYGAIESSQKLAVDCNAVPYLYGSVLLLLPLLKRLRSDDDCHVVIKPYSGSKGKGRLAHANSDTIVDAREAESPSGSIGQASSGRSSAAATDGHTTRSDTYASGAGRQLRAEFNGSALRQSSGADDSDSDEDRRERRGRVNAPSLSSAPSTHYTESLQESIISDLDLRTQSSASSIHPSVSDDEQQQVEDEPEEDEEEGQQQVEDESEEDGEEGQQEQEQPHEEENQTAEAEGKVEHEDLDRYHEERGEVQEQDQVASPSSLPQGQNPLLRPSFSDRGLQSSSVSFALPHIDRSPSHANFYPRRLSGHSPDPPGRRNGAQEQGNMSGQGPSQPQNDPSEASGSQGRQNTITMSANRGFGYGRRLSNDEHVPGLLDYVGPDSAGIQLYNSNQEPERIFVQPEQPRFGLFESHPSSFTSPLAFDSSTEVVRLGEVRSHKPVFVNRLSPLDRLRENATAILRNDPSLNSAQVDQLIDVNELSGDFEPSANECGTSAQLRDIRNQLARVMVNVSNSSQARQQQQQQQQQERSGSAASPSAAQSAWGLASSHASTSQNLGHPHPSSGHSSATQPTAEVSWPQTASSSPHSLSASVHYFDPLSETPPTQDETADF